MTKYTKMPQLIDTNPTMSVSSASSTFTVQNLKIGQAKSVTKSNEEEKALVLPKIVVVNNNNEEGWNDIIKGNQKAKSSGNGTGAIVTAIYDQKLTTTDHGNILSKTTPITDPPKMEKKKTKKKKKPTKPPSSSRSRSKSPPIDFDQINLSQTATLTFEEKKQVMKLQAEKYRSEGKSSLEFFLSRRTE